MPKVEVGEKIPGTYCPLCGEMGLRLMVFSKVTWAVCPMIDGEPVVRKLGDAHTAFKINPTRLEKPEEQDSVAELGSPTARAGIETQNEKENDEGVTHE